MAQAWTFLAVGFVFSKTRLRREIAFHSTTYAAGPALRWTHPLTECQTESGLNGMGGTAQPRVAVGHSDATPQKSALVQLQWSGSRGPSVRVTIGRQQGAPQTRARMGSDPKRAAHPLIFGRPLWAETRWPRPIPALLAAISGSGPRRRAGGAPMLFRLPSLKQGSEDFPSSSLTVGRTPPQESTWRRYRGG